MRRGLIVLLAVVVAGAAIVVVGHRRSGTQGASMTPDPRHPDSSAAGAAVTVSSSSTASSRNGTAGVDDDVTAARRAGIAAVARTADVFGAGFIARQDLIATLATKRFAPQLAERTSQQILDLLFGLRQATGHQVEVDMVVQPVTATATVQPDGRVAVDVWTVAVFVSDGSTTAPEQWLTVQLIMAWESGRWLVDDWTTVAGPAPTPPTDGTFGSAAEVAQAVAWPTAVVGGG